MNHLWNKKSQDFQIQHKRIRENQMSQAIDYQRKNGHGRNAFDMIPISKTMTSICVVDWQFFQHDFHADFTNNAHQINEVEDIVHEQEIDDDSDIDREDVAQENAEDHM